MDHIESINLGLANKTPHNEIVRKIFLTYPTKVLIGNEERQFDILDEISKYFDVPITSVQVVGSAKLGLNLLSKIDFDKNRSDLDIAIIDSHLFRKYTEMIFQETDGYNDRSKFSLENGKSKFKSYESYISKGIFRPDFLPSGKTRINWNIFFNNLTEKNRDLFKSISGGIYFSQIFFEEKQCKTLKKYHSNEAI